MILLDGNYHVANEYKITPRFGILFVGFLLMVLMAQWTYHVDNEAKVVTISFVSPLNESLLMSFYKL